MNLVYDLFHTQTRTAKLENSRVQL